MSNSFFFPADSNCNYSCWKPEFISGVDFERERYFLNKHYLWYTILHNTSKTDYKNDSKRITHYKDDQYFK